MKSDPVVSNPDLYSVVFENNRVRVLQYVDSPGQATVPHNHPDSVMITLSAFRHRLVATDTSIDVDLPAETARWLSAQRHSGENIDETETHCIFVELKEPAPSGNEPGGFLGPTAL